MSFQDLILNKCYDKLESFLLKEWVKVEKTNRCGLWKNRRQVKISDGYIMYAHVNVSAPKMKVQLTNCNHLGSELQNNSVFILKCQFLEKFCQNIHNNFIFPNSTKSLTWEFIVKDQNELQQIKNKIYQYENKWFLNYIQTYKWDETIKQQFYSLFSNYCIEQTNNYKTSSYIQKDIKIRELIGDQENLFKQYRRISKVLSQVKFGQNCHIVPPLICIVMMGSDIYECTHIMPGKKEQNNQQIKAEIQRISDQNEQFQQLLQSYNIEYFKHDNNFEYALLSYKQNNQIVQIESVDDKISKLNKLEIYDYQQLSYQLHQHEIHMSQIGSILQHQNLQHKDLEKLLKVEIIARSLKTVLKKILIRIDKALLKLLIQSFINKDEIQSVQHIFTELKKITNEKFKIPYDNLNKFPTNDVLLINSLMNQLNFFIPLDIKKMLNSVGIKDCLDYDKIVLKTKCRTYFQDFDTFQQPADSCLNYKYLESIKQECLQDNRLKYISLAKNYLGVNNSLLARFYYEGKMDNISLKKGLEILEKVQPYSPLIQDIQREINGVSNSENTIKHSNIVFRQLCTLNYNEQQKKIVEISDLIIEELPNGLLCTLNDDELMKLKDDEIFKYAQQKYNKGLYDHVLKILGALRDKQKIEVLLLGFKSEKNMQNLKQNIYTIKLLNYFILFGLQSASDIQTIEEIFWLEISRFIGQYLEYDKFYYKRLCDEIILQIDKQKFILEMFQFWKNKQIVNLREYSALQFDILNENKNQILQNLNNQLKDPQLHAVKFIKNIFMEIKF